MSIKNDLKTVACGFLMGGADIIPGVSGGTVALILGIYERLVTAISHFDLTFLAHLKRREFAAALEHIDLRFLGTLFLGIGGGIVGLASLMHYLLEEQQEATYAGFFGLIVASAMIVSRMIPRWTIPPIVALVAGTVFAYVLVRLPALSSPPNHDGYVFLCGLVAICAMILPGISGAFILLILGKYEAITEELRNWLHGDGTLEGLAMLGSFAAGAGIGLLLFSKLLRWLLARHESVTLAVLCGFMLGSLRKIWPFQEDLTPDITNEKLKQFRNIIPDALDASVVAAVAIAIVAGGFVLLLDHFANASKRAAAKTSE